MKYDNATQGARLAATLAMIDGGTLEVGTKDFADVLVRFRLSAPQILGADDEGAPVELAFAPARAIAMIGGTCVAARVVDSRNQVRITGLTVGDEESDAQVQIPNPDIKKGQTIELAGFRLIHA